MFINRGPRVTFSDAPSVGGGTNVLNPPAQPEQQQHQQQQQQPAALKFGEFVVPAERTDYVRNKGWDNAEALLDSYANLEKLVGVPETQRADRLFVHPGADAKPEDVAEFIGKATKMDVPEKAEDYGIAALVPEGIDGAIFKAAEGVFKEAGVPKTLAAPIVKGMLDVETKLTEAFIKQSGEDVIALQGELGGKFEDEMELGRRAMKAAELDEQKVDAIERAIGTKAMLNMFRALGKGVTEATSPTPDPTNPSGGNQFRMTKEQAQARRTQMMADQAFMSRYLSPNYLERSKAINEMETIDKIIAGEG